MIWGGAPGEWEGEHPHTSRRASGVEGVFFAGWRGHDDLPLGLGCADCFVAPSTDEPFGLVYLEAMACGLPVIGTLSGGPPSFVNVVPGEPDGWLVPPDDEEALAAAIVHAVNDAGERSAARRERRPARPRELLVGRIVGALHRPLRARRGRPRPTPCPVRSARAACRARCSGRARPRHRRRR